MLRELLDPQVLLERLDPQARLELQGLREIQAILVQPGLPELPAQQVQQAQRVLRETLVGLGWLARLDRLVRQESPGQPELRVRLVAQVLLDRLCLLRPGRLHSWEAQQLLQQDQPPQE